MLPPWWPCEGETPSRQPPGRRRYHSHPLDAVQTFFAVSRGRFRREEEETQVSPPSSRKIFSLCAEDSRILGIYNCRGTNHNEEAQKDEKGCYPRRDCLHNLRLSGRMGRNVVRERFGFRVRRWHFAGQTFGDNSGPAENPREPRVMVQAPARRLPRRKEVMIRPNWRGKKRRRGVGAAGPLSR